MSDFYFHDPKHPVAKIEESRRFDVSDPKWGHPAFQEMWPNQNWPTTYEPSVPMEERIAYATNTLNSYLDMLKGQNPLAQNADVAEYEVPGCPEEPDTPVKVQVYRKKGSTRKNAPAMFFSMGGALAMGTPYFWPIDRFCDDFDCAVVVPLYRMSWEGQYPAAINDLHAVYQWMYDNARELGVDADNTILLGHSTGGHLSLAFAFRLMRYGYSPKGVVATCPQTDDREHDDQGFYIWSESQHSVDNHDWLKQWMGDDFGSNRVGPEALANHARVCDCVGYPPCFIHSVELDSDRDNNRHFYEKLLAARTYAEYHCWAGDLHGGQSFFGVTVAADLNEVSERIKPVVYGEIRDLWNYDLRRPWVVEDLKENGPWW